LPAETCACQNAAEPEESGDAGKAIRDGRGAKDTVKPEIGNPAATLGV